MLQELLVAPVISCREIQCRSPGSRRRLQKLGHGLLALLREGMRVSHSTEPVGEGHLAVAAQAVFVKKRNSDELPMHDAPDMGNKRLGFLSLETYRGVLRAEQLAREQAPFDSGAGVVLNSAPRPLALCGEEILLPVLPPPLLEHVNGITHRNRV